MLRSWNAYKLSELSIKIGSGATPRGGNEAYKESGISLIRSQNVLDFSFSTNGLAFIDDAQAKVINNVTVESRDVLLNITGDSVARVCQVPDDLIPARVNQHVTIIRADQKKLTPEFLKYSLLSPPNKNTLLTMAGSGATRNALTKGMIEDFEISIPPLPEQRAIASILSALDDKIELNLQMNKTLEEMAMALYKHWFVDFGPFRDGEFVASELGEIPKGWEVKTVAHVADVNAKTLGKSNEPKQINYIDIASVNKGWVENIQPLLYSEAPSRARRIISDGDIVWSTVRPNRESRFLTLGFDKNTIVSTGFCVITPKNVPYSYLYPLMCMPSFVDYLISRATGSSYPAVLGKDFEEANILIPSNYLLFDYNILAEPLYVKYSLNIIENRTLTTLRDTLLPKLISGEVRVKDAAKSLAEVL